MAMIELVELSLAILAAEAHLVLADDPGELIGEVAGDVVAALGTGVSPTGSKFVMEMFGALGK